MSRHVSALVLASFLALPLAAAETPAAREVLAADAARTTSSGATFTAPAGWAIDGEGPARRPRRRRRATRISRSSTSTAKDADAAVAAAWAAYKPESSGRSGSRRRRRRAQRLGGAEDLRIRDVAERARGRRRVRVARREGLDGRSSSTRPSRRSRSAARRSVSSSSSLRPKGYSRESVRREEGASRSTRRGSRR